MLERRCSVTKTSNTRDRCSSILAVCCSTDAEKYCGRRGLTSAHCLKQQTARSSRLSARRRPRARGWAVAGPEASPHAPPLSGGGGWAGGGLGRGCLSASECRRDPRPAAAHEVLSFLLVIFFSVSRQHPGRCPVRSAGCGSGNNGSAEERVRDRALRARASHYLREERAEPVEGVWGKPCTASSRTVEKYSFGEVSCASLHAIFSMQGKTRTKTLKKFQFEGSIPSFIYFTFFKRCKLAIDNTGLFWTFLHEGHQFS